MTATAKPSLLKLLSLPVLIFIACTLITFSTPFKKNPGALSVPLLLDLLLTAPVAYYFAIRKTTLPLISVLRVFLAGVVVASLLLAKSNTAGLAFVKTWISSLAEATLILFLGWKFYQANAKAKRKPGTPIDFLSHCRTVLTSTFGNEKMASLFASEVAVFYYAFTRKAKGIDSISRFTCYKENGTVLVLNTFLCLFMIETAGMHFLFMLWSKTAAWVLTTLSLYTCLQLFAHIKALKKRPIVIHETQLLLRNGLMGGDVSISIDNIQKIEVTRKLPDVEAVQKLALIKGLENHNLALYLKKPVWVLKAFVIKKMAQVVLLHVDRPTAFIEALAVKMKL